VPQVIIDAASWTNIVDVRASLDMKPKYFTVIIASKAETIRRSSPFKAASLSQPWIAASLRRPYSWHYRSSQ